MASLRVFIAYLFGHVVNFNTVQLHSHSFCRPLSAFYLSCSAWFLSPSRSDTVCHLFFCLSIASFTLFAAPRHWLLFPASAKLELPIGLPRLVGWNTCCLNVLVQALRVCVPDQTRATICGCRCKSPSCWDCAFHQSLTSLTPASAKQVSSALQKTTSVLSVPAQGLIFQSARQHDVSELLLALFHRYAPVRDLFHYRMSSTLECTMCGKSRDTGESKNVVGDHSFYINLDLGSTTLLDALRSFQSEVLDDPDNLIQCQGDCGQAPTIHIARRRFFNLPSYTDFCAQSFP